MTALATRRTELSEGTAQAAATEARLAAIPRVTHARLPARPGGGWLPFYPRGHTSWAEMLPIIEAVRQRSDLTPVVILATEQGAPYRQDCERLGLGCIVTEAIPNQDRGHFPALDRVWRNLLKRLPWLKPLDRLLQQDRVAHALPLARLRARRASASIARDRALFREILRALEPFLLVVSGDRELGPALPLIGASRDLGISSLMVTPVIASIEADSKARAGHLRFRADGGGLLENRRLAREIPEQVAETPYGPMLFSPGWLIRVFEEEGLWPANPWMQGGGPSTWVVASGPWQREVFRRFRCAEERIKVFGLIHHDPLFEAWSRRDEIRGELVERHGLDPARQIYVLSLPTFAEQGALDWPEHWRQLEAHLDVLAEAGVNVLCSLHPKQEPTAYRELCGRYGFAIEETRLFRFLPAADVFVSAGSSTIDWAILCGIPAVNLDYIGLETEIWKDFPGVVDARGAEDFRRVVQRLTGEPAWRDELARKQWEGSRRLGLFDGKAGQRMIDFMLEVRARGAEADRRQEKNAG